MWDYDDPNTRARPVDACLFAPSDEPPAGHAGKPAGELPMYESFYGLREKPFNLTPDPDYFYMSPGHENVLTHLEYAIQESKGFVVVTGEVGSGKTTLINYLLRKIPQGIHVGIINNTLIQFQELLRMICLEFELDIANADKSVLLARLYSFLLDKYSKRERVILIIDEAQNLPEKTLEEIRLLSNLEAEKHHLIQMILVGQPQLKEKLERKNLEQFVQRITVYCHLGALDEVQTNQYIRHRLKVAGARNLDLFDQAAIFAIVENARGIPRLINMLCDAALVYGYADDAPVISRDLIEAVAQARPPGRKKSQPEPLAAEEKIYDEGPSKHLIELKQDVDDRFKRMEEKLGALEALLRKEFDDRSKQMEEKLGAQEARIADVLGRVESLQGHRDARDRVILELFRMMKKSLNRRADVVTARLEEQGFLSKPASKKKTGGKQPIVLVQQKQETEST